MNAAIEFHDSRIVAVESTPDIVVVRLEAYVHRSEGRPGIDSGSGWSETVELRFAGGIVEELPTELPGTLSNGQVSGGDFGRGLIPLPTSVGAAVCFEAVTQCGERIAVRGAALDVVAITDGVFVDLFPGMAQPLRRESGDSSRP